MKKITILFLTLFLLVLNISANAQTITLDHEEHSIIGGDYSFPELECSINAISSKGIKNKIIQVFIYVAVQGYVWIGNFSSSLNSWVSKATAFPVPLGVKIERGLSAAIAIGGVVKSHFSPSGDVVAHYNDSDCVWSRPDVWGYWICP